MTKTRLVLGAIAIAFVFTALYLLVNDNEQTRFTPAQKISVTHQVPANSDTDTLFNGVPTHDDEAPGPGQSTGLGTGGLGVVA